MQEQPNTGETRKQSASGKRTAERAEVYRRRRLGFLVAFAVLVLVVTGIVLTASAASSPQSASAETLLATEQTSAVSPVQAAPQDHPAFARFEERNLLLPVEAKDATIIAYKPVSDDRALPVTPLGEQANANALVRFFRGIFASDPPIRYYLLDGEGKNPTTSMLIGAPPGTPVYAPVSGVVTGVIEYLLYGKYNDVQVDIRPERSSGITVSLILLADPVVSIGDRVTAGKTVLGKVRECPEQLGRALSQYTHDSGSHIYLQVMEEPVR